MIKRLEGFGPHAQHFVSKLLLFFVLLCGVQGHALAVPSHFSDKMESALTCRSEWSADYWRAYLNQHFGAALRNWGGAQWYKAEGAELAGNQIKEVFINLPDTSALMVGVLIEKPVADVRKQIEAKLGISFIELPGPYPRYLSRSGSMLIGLDDPQKPQTKWYCARWNLGNRP